jgi:hypothetical protein
VPLKEASEQVAVEPAAQAAELSATLVRTIIRAMRIVLEIIILEITVVSSFLFFVRLPFVLTLAKWRGVHRHWSAHR